MVSEPFRLSKAERRRRFFNLILSFFKEPFPKSGAGSNILIQIPRLGEGPRMLTIAFYVYNFLAIISVEFPIRATIRITSRRTPKAEQSSPFCQLAASSIIRTNKEHTHG